MARRRESTLLRRERGSVYFGENNLVCYRLYEVAVFACMTATWDSCASDKHLLQHLLARGDLPFPVFFLRVNDRTPLRRQRGGTRVRVSCRGTEQCPLLAPSFICCHAWTASPSPGKTVFRFFCCLCRASHQGHRRLVCTENLFYQGHDFHSNCTQGFRSGFNTKCSLPSLVIFEG